MLRLGHKKPSEGRFIAILTVFLWSGGEDKDMEPFLGKIRSGVTGGVTERGYKTPKNTPLSWGGKYTLFERVGRFSGRVRGIIHPVFSSTHLYI